MGLVSDLPIHGQGSFATSAAPAAGRPGRVLSRLNARYRMVRLCGLNRNGWYALPFVGLGRLFWMEPRRRRVRNCRHRSIPFGCGRVAPRRLGEGIPRDRTTGGHPLMADMDGHGGCARIGLEEGVSHAVWSIADLGVGRPTVHRVLAQERETRRPAPPGDRPGGSLPRPRPTSPPPTPRIRRPGRSASCSAARSRTAARAIPSPMSATSTATASTISSSARRRSPPIRRATSSRADGQRPRPTWSTARSKPTPPRSGNVDWLTAATRPASGSATSASSACANGTQTNPITGRRASPSPASGSSPARTPTRCWARRSRSIRDINGGNALLIGAPARPTQTAQTRARAGPISSTPTPR